MARRIAETKPVINLLEDNPVEQVEDVKDEVNETDTGVAEKAQDSIDERILLKRILVDNASAPVFAIIRDTLDDSEPERWNSIIRKWIAADMFIIIPPGTDIRDGYLTELGKFYAKAKYNL